MFDQSLRTDATDLEIQRREHDREMGYESPAERRWSHFYDMVDAEVVARGWCGMFDSGKPRGLDEDEATHGFSIDGAHDAWLAGLTVHQYIAAVAAKRTELGL